tara:strand:- start:681 stop:1184 length:504 start_codon:yes stop_codon:yes gene_type:complete
MIGAGGLTKVVRRFQMAFPSKKEGKLKEYKDKYPKKLPTLEDVKNKYGTVVWCKFAKCASNQEVKDLQRTTGTLLKRQNYTPINKQEHIWAGICTRSEIGIQFDEMRLPHGAKLKVPSCYTAHTDKTGYWDFSQFLNADGSPLGGNIDSQHVSDEGYGAMDSNNIYQ